MHRHQMVKYIVAKAISFFNLNHHDRFLFVLNFALPCYTRYTHMFKPGLTYLEICHARLNSRSTMTFNSVWYLIVYVKMIGFAWYNIYIYTVVRELKLLDYLMFHLFKYKLSESGSWQEYYSTWENYVTRLGA